MELLKNKKKEAAIIMMYQFLQHPDKCLLLVSIPHDY